MQVSVFANASKLILYGYYTICSGIRSIIVIDVYANASKLTLQMQVSVWPIYKYEVSIKYTYVIQHLRIGMYHHHLWNKFKCRKRRI